MLTFNQLKKNIRKDHTGFRKVRLAILADSASQLLHQAIKGYGYECQVDFEIYEADYNQIERQVFDSASELFSFNPEYVFICRSSEHLIKDFYKSASKAAFAEQQQVAVRSYVETLTAKLGCKVIINTLTEINDSVFGNYAAKVETGFTYQVRKANVLLMDLSRELKNLFIFDLAALQSAHGYRFTFDPKMYVTADMVFSLDFLPHLAFHVCSIIQSISGVFRKCLILDLDNTTWGGIIGDDGMEGIQVGDLGIGKAFTELQLWALQLRHRGIILAVCSKNTEEIAKEPFRAHPDMVLRLDDIAMFVANWENKVDNIRHIQGVLNIGFDSMVFLDDNPFERNMVKEAIPELTVPELPEDPAEYLQYLRQLNLFETASFTAEDSDRTRQYQEEAGRTILQRSFANEDEFLENLGMESDVKPFDDFTIPRIAQLTQRSNQFNLRTIRYTDEDIRQIAKSPEYITMSLTLRDKFGDHGLICTIILKKKDQQTLFIDTWIMSCRVLKRGMEAFTLNMIVDCAKANGFTRIEGEYIPTRKNVIVLNHYADLGFTEEDGRWVLDAGSFSPRNSYIHQIKNAWIPTGS